MAVGAPKVLQRGERARSVAGTSVVERWRALSKHTYVLGMLLGRHDLHRQGRVRDARVRVQRALPEGLSR